MCRQHTNCTQEKGTSVNAREKRKGGRTQPTYSGKEGILAQCKGVRGLGSPREILRAGKRRGTRGSVIAGEKAELDIEKSQILKTTIKEAIDA